MTVSFYVIPLQAREFVGEIVNSEKLVIIEQLSTYKFAYRFPFQNIGYNLPQQDNVKISASANDALRSLQNFVIIETDDEAALFGLNIKGLTIHGPLTSFTLDQITPNDSLWSKQWALQELGIPKAWNISRGDNVLVSVIDTGCEIDHPDLKKNIYINSKEDINSNDRFDAWPSTEIRDGIAGDLNGIDEDGNGWTDDVTGYDFVDQSFTNIGDDRFPDPIVIDEHGHGTSVAGIIGAESNNAIGISGIAPNCKLMTVRAFDATGNAEEDDVALAIAYAALNKARVICMSFGDAVYSPMTKAAIDFAHSMNCILIASSGNDGKTDKRYPAGYEHVIAVGATNTFNTRAPFSSYGSRLSMVAPGTGIMTTARRGGYRSFQGTSAAAPMVAGTAALLLGVNPSANTDDITGMILSSTKDLGEMGWDIEYGSGLVNPLNALAKKGGFEAQITSPKRDAIIMDQDSIPIIGSTVTPMFSAWSLDYGFGDTPTMWNSIAFIKQVRVMNDTLGFLTIVDSLRNTDITLRLSIWMKDGSSIEYRNGIRIVSQDSSLRLISTSIDSVWRDDRTVSMVRATFSQPCRASVKIVKDADTLHLHDDDKVSFSHQYLLPHLHGKAYTASIHAGYLHDADSFFTTVNAISPIGTGNPFSAERTSYTMPMTYLYENVIKDKFDNPAIIGTDYSTGTFGNTRIYSFNGNGFQITDSIAESWIVKGVADVNGDGQSEVLAHSLGEMRLFGKDFKGSNLSAFGKVLLKETMIPGLQEFWSAGLKDITGDGIAEIFGFSDTNCVALTFENTAFRILGFMPNPTSRGPGGSANSMRPPAISIADFDKDDKPDIVYGDTDGDIIHYEFENGNFILKQTIESFESGATEFTRAGDLDGDGTAEFIVGRYVSPELNGQREYDAPLWSLTIYKATQDSLQAIHRELIYGARVGLDYRNGISIGNLDDKPGEEIVFCAFPNSYVFGFENGTLINRFHYPQCFSNNAVIGDINGNGINEFGFGDGNAIRFFEMQSSDGINIPRALTATSISGSQAKLNWSGNAEIYQILAVENPTFQNDTLRIITSTDSSSIVLDGLTNQSLYEFYVRGISGDDTSGLSIPAYAYIHEPFEPRKKQEDIAILSNGNALKIRYTGPLANTYPSPKVFELKGENAPFVSTAIPVGDSSILLNLSSALAPSKRYILHCGEILDAFDSPTNIDSIIIETDASLNVNIPFILTQLHPSPYSLILTYSEAVNKSQAMDVNSYILEPTGEIAWIDSINDRTFSLMIDPNTPLRSIGKEYHLSARNVQSLNGKTLDPKGSSFSFLIDGFWNGAYCYPQPWKTKETALLTFAGLPNSASITIRRLTGEIIATLTEMNGAGGIVWDGILDDGSTIQTGVYLYSIDIGGKPEIKKFSVIRE